MKEKENEKITFEIFTLQNESNEIRTSKNPFKRPEQNSPKSINGKSTRIQPKNPQITESEEENE